MSSTPGHHVLMRKLKKRNSSAKASSSSSSSDPADDFGTRRDPIAPSAPRALPRLGACSTVAAADRTSDHIFSGDSFASLGLDARLALHLESATGMGLANPTQCQRQAIPAVMTGKDTLVQSETGSGKTLCYLVPILARLANGARIDRNSGTRAIVVLPTRELAAQVLSVVSRLFRPYPWLVPGSVTGGERKKSEKGRLRKGLVVLVATPGRLIDHLENTASFNVRNLNWLVLDEADRLLDLGFEKQLTKIISELRKRTSEPFQGVLLSATQGAGINRLASLSLRSPVFIHAKEDASLGDADGGAKTIPRQLNQHVIVAPTEKRLIVLSAFLAQHLADPTARSRIIVFMSTCDSVDFHFDLLCRMAAMSGASDQESKEGNSTKELEAAALYAPMKGVLWRLHGNVPQSERTRNMQQFSSAQRGILLCTDVAARGLDLPNISWVVQYDPPTESSEYVHRVGRTARRGKSGSALLFLAPRETPYLKMLEDQGVTMINLACESVFTALPEQFECRVRKLMPVPKKKKATKGGKVPEKKELGVQSGAMIATASSQIQFACETIVAKDKGLKQQACTAFGSYVRAYATYSKEAREFFNVRTLHLGHVAKCFALRDPPKRISAIRSKAKRTKASAGESDTAKTSAKRQKPEKKKDKSRASKETSKKRPKAKMMSGAAIVSSEFAS